MKKLNKISSIILCFLLMLLFTACKSTESEVSSNEFEKAKAEIQQAKASSNENEETTSDNQTTQPNIKENKLIEVDGGNQSGHREPNVVVDIGYGDREYYAYTNEHNQLVKVIARKITLQDESTEPVLSTGRYYRDEAKVPGVESPTLDEGHVIADSLGGVSNAYNITPQESTLNRHGDQAYMEKAIRDAGGCTDFVAVITYPNTNTQIPSHYSYTYTINGHVVNDEFDNVNPDKVNAKLETNVSTKEQTNNISKDLMITALDKKAEYIVITNLASKSVDLTGWKIISVTGNQSFTFPKFTLDSNSSVKVGDSAKNSDVEFHWLDSKGTWNNSKSDPAELYNTKGELVYRFDD
ncbi:lamin tail domain-containing protein [Tepidibacter hydrothermalis]|uniref:Lamin tail domain-containing protein n=1 Tax=Tepidibacter hydrothermalis TaxID=3036126 RepID=A0ABY8EA47_9FIRM|nr:lamin tail domain-containing protein [Tepidibacter hydrothermalis]WFD08684.1 lamin tail domain-containing protein [Tepidibacter hydrothermalis]